MDLFDSTPADDRREGAPAPSPGAPLADRIRPRTIDEVVGQDHLLGPGRVLRSAIEANSAAVADYRAGKVTAMNFLKGQVMKQTRGKANPAIAEELLRKLLG